MRYALLAISALAIVGTAVPATAQPAPPLAGTRLDISATGEVSRVPDVAIISAGVMTRSATATDAIAQNAARMERVRAALRRAGIADRDIQTTNVSLNPDYRYEQNQPPILTGYQASNQVTVRFRDIRSTGRILDALVAEGANQINGPTLAIDKPEAALDEARTIAIATGRARAELYARALGMQVVRLVAVSEGGGFDVPRPMPYASEIAVTGTRVAKTDIDPGEQKVGVTLSMSFELR